ncbi:MAG: thioesterase family protein [Deltaproteobacteria bacterium]|nr:thioesterase family protein [Deltaproteobacteria bacterium]MBW2420416.1 thioesterase family protein [Deltaproteobacteria bacterium]
MLDSAAAPDSRPVFHLDGALLVPTGLATGPWYADSQHGSAMLGLLARAVEQFPAPGPVQVTRLTVDFMRAAPLIPVSTPVRLLRRGRTTEVLETEITANGEVYARATAMRFRVADLPVTDEAPRYGLGRPMHLPSADEIPSADGLDRSEEDAFHMALEMRPNVGPEGPAIWFRMRNSLVAGEALTPTVRAAIVADWTYAVPIVHQALLGNEAQEERSLSPISPINPDTSVNLHRPMEGEWVCLDAHVYYGDLGAGTAVAQLFDERGPIGHSSQSLLIREGERMPAAERERSRH